MFWQNDHITLTARKKGTKTSVYLAKMQLFLYASFKWQGFTTLEKKNHTLQLIKVNPFSVVFTTVKSLKLDH